MTITFSGDICVNSPINNISFSNSVRDLFEETDYSFACLEGPIINGDTKPFCKIGPNLKQDKSVVDFFPLFTHMSLANNHIMDYGYEGCSQTISFLSEYGLIGAGASDRYPTMYEPIVLEKDGIKVSVFCWAEAQYGCCKSEVEGNGFAWLLNPRTYHLIQEFKKKTDYVILFLHAGLEDVDLPLVDWRLCYKSFIDYGADLIVASHPHRIQGREIYKGKQIYYSLGNFFFNGQYQQNDPSWSNSMTVCCEISKEKIKTKESFYCFTNNFVSDAKKTEEERFAQLSAILEQEKWENYMIQHNIMLEKCWNEYYKSYFSFPIWKQKQGVPFYRKWFNNLMEQYVHRCFLPPVSLNKIYHNINIDTHRFAVSRYCALKSKTF